MAPNAATSEIVLSHVRLIVYSSQESPIGDRVGQPFDTMKNWRAFEVGSNNKATKMIFGITNVVQGRTFLDRVERLYRLDFQLGRRHRNLSQIECSSSEQ